MGVGIITKLGEFFAFDTWRCDEEGQDLVLRFYTKEYPIHKAEMKTWTIARYILPFTILILFVIEMFGRSWDKPFLPVFGVLLGLAFLSLFWSLINALIEEKDYNTFAIRMPNTEENRKKAIGVGELVIGLPTTEVLQWDQTYRVDTILTQEEMLKVF